MEYIPVITEDWQGAQLAFTVKMDMNCIDMLSKELCTLDCGLLVSDTV